MKYIDDRVIGGPQIADDYLARKMALQAILVSHCLKEQFKCLLKYTIVPWKY